MDSPPRPGAGLGLSAKAVWQIAERYQQSGLDRGLFDGARPGKAPAVNQEQRQRIIGGLLAASGGAGTLDPTGLTEEAIRRKLVARFGRETVRGLLEGHHLKL